MLDVKDLLAHPGPHIALLTVFNYLWFGAGSVPWKGQGKYPLAQLLFLLSGVIATHQLDILYEVFLLIAVALLVHYYMVWCPCTKGVPYVPTNATVNPLDRVSKLRYYKGTAKGSIIGMYYKGLTLVALSHGQVKVLIPAKTDKLKRLSSIPWDFKNEMLLVPRLRKLGKFTQRILRKITFPFPTSYFGTTGMLSRVSSTYYGCNRDQTYGISVMSLANLGRARL